MDKSSQILLFLIILVLLMLISITVINHITKKKNNKYDIDNKNIKRYSDLIKEEDKMERELTFEYLKKSLSGDLVEPKKKVKSKDLEGQISIF